MILLSHQGTHQLTISLKKSLIKTPPINIQCKIGFKVRKLFNLFQVKDHTKFEHRHDVACEGNCPEKCFTNNYIGDMAR